MKTKKAGSSAIVNQRTATTNCATTSYPDRAALQERAAQHGLLSHVERKVCAPRLLRGERDVLMDWISSKAPPIPASGRG